MKVFWDCWSFRVKQVNAGFLCNTSLFYTTHKTIKTYIVQVLQRTPALPSFAQGFSTSFASGYDTMNRTIITPRVSQLFMDRCGNVPVLEIVISPVFITEQFQQIWNEFLTVLQPIYIAICHYKRLPPVSVRYRGVPLAIRRYYTSGGWGLSHSIICCLSYCETIAWALGLLR